MSKMPASRPQIPMELLRGVCAHVADGDLHMSVNGGLHMVVGDSLPSKNLMRSNKGSNEAKKEVKGELMSQNSSKSVGFWV